MSAVKVFQNRRLFQNRGFTVFVFFSYPVSWWLNFTSLIVFKIMIFLFSISFTIRFFYNEEKDRMPIFKAIQTFCFGICLPSWDVYTDLLLIITLLTPYYCLPYSADEYIKRYPYEKFPEMYSVNLTNELPLKGKNN